MDVYLEQEELLDTSKDLMNVDEDYIIGQYGNSHSEAHPASLSTVPPKGDSRLRVVLFLEAAGLPSF